MISNPRAADRLPDPGRASSGTLMDHLSKHALDGAVGAAAVTAPLWLQLVQSGSQVLVALGGVVLVALRIAIALRDLRK